MGLHLSRRGYSVRVDGVLRGNSEFVIRGEIAYAANLSKEEWLRLSPMAQLDLLLAIEGEERRERRVGARRAGLLGRGGQPGLAVKPVDEA